jgi:hypothetical protein
MLSRMKTAITVAGLSLSGLATAHGGGKGPHGGQTTDFGGAYHMEGVLEGDAAHFYLLDEDAKGTTLAKQDGGTVTVVVPGQGVKTSAIAAGASFSEATAPVVGKGKVTANVKLKVGEKTYSATFKFDKK